MSRSAKGNYNRTFQSCELRDRLKAYKESKNMSSNRNPKMKRYIIKTHNWYRYTIFIAHCINHYLERNHESNMMFYLTKYELIVENESKLILLFLH